LWWVVTSRLKMWMENYKFWPSNRNFAWRLCFLPRTISLFFMLYSLPDFWCILCIFKWTIFRDEKTVTNKIMYPNATYTHIICIRTLVAYLLVMQPCLCKSDDKASITWHESLLQKRTYFYKQLTDLPQQNHVSLWHIGNRILKQCDQKKSLIPHHKSKSRPGKDCFSTFYLWSYGVFMIIYASFSNSTVVLQQLVAQFDTFKAANIILTKFL